MASGINPIGSLQGKVDSNHALVVALDGPLDVGAEDITTTGTVDAGAFAVGGVAGASGTFTAQSGEVVTVVNGLITSIV